MKKMTIISILAMILVLVGHCAADSDLITFSNDGLNLSIPAEYDGLLVVDMPENSENDILFSVSEKASIDAAIANGETGEGAGWLFSIGRVSEDQYHEMICDDMSGAEVFAKDANDVYYMYYHPTDVRLVREDYSYIDADLQEWGTLNEWAYSVKASFTEENGLTEETYGNSMLEIYLARLMYRNDVNYTVSTLEYGPKEPKGVKASDYIEPLVKDARYEILRDEEAPDGEYLVLKFPDDDVRFDFFFMEGKENYIRQVWFEGLYETLYRVEFDDENLKASDIMHDLYRDMVLADSLGYTPDSLVGTWADKIAGRCSIEISKTDTEGVYNVMIHWGSSAFETAVWTMTATPTGNGAELRYEDCTMVDILFTSEDQSTETILYENGKGTFNLLSTNELVWNDETEHAADDMVFINAGR